MKEQIRYFIAGIFIGISELLPGISGATVALMFGVYEKLLTFLTQLKGFNLIIPLLVGMVLSVFLFSSLINYLYENFTDIFNFLIAILMIGYGIFLIINTYLKENISQGISFYITFLLAIFIGFNLSSFNMYSSEEPKMILLAILGFIACSFLLFPGISGSAFLLSVGAYTLIIQSISNLNFNVLLPFAIGMLIALILMPRLINKAYKKFGKSVLVFFGGLILTAGLVHFL
jgi:putative membrane protein